MSDEDVADRITSRLIHQTTSPFVRVNLKSLTYPSIAEFEKYIQSKCLGTRGKQSKMTGYKLRRLVVMCSLGQSYSEVAEAIGVNKSTVATWWTELPLEMKGTS